MLVRLFKPVAAIAGAFFLAALFAVMIAGVSRAAGAVSTVTPAVSSVNEAPDYATDKWSDPWDYNNAEDLNLTPNVASSGIANATMNGGILSYDIAGSSNYIEPAWGSGVVAHGRDTDINPIDAGKYTRLSFRMYASADDNGGQVSWFSCDAATPSCWGAMPLPVKQGWHTYDVALAPGYGPATATQPWSGQIKVLRVSPGNAAGLHVEFGWMRLYQPGPQVTLNVTGGSGNNTVWFDSDPADSSPTQVEGKSAGVLASGVPAGGAVTFPAGAYPPGTYRFYAVSNGQASGYGNPLAIDSEPEPVVMAPSITGGDDYATTVRHDPWDLSQPSDVTAMYNFTGQFVYGFLDGVTNSTPTPWDPQVYLSQPGLINASLYHRLTFRVYYDGPFGLANTPGGGMVARFIYKVNNIWHNSQDIIVFPGWNTVSVDLKTNPPSQIDDETDPDPVGWGGPASQWVQEVRFDPHEDPGYRHWDLDYIELTTDDYGKPDFNIQFRDNAWTAGATADIYANSSTGSYRIATGVSVTQGVNSYDWNGAGIPGAGPWWIFVVLHHPDGSTGQAYSTGPVDMTPPADQTPPVVSYTGPAGAVTSGGPAVTATVADPAPSSGINAASARMTLNGGFETPCTVSGGNISCPTSGLDNGSYTAKISIRDNAGNEGAATGSFTVSGQSYLVYNDYFTWYDDAGGYDWVMMANPASSAQDLTFNLGVAGNPEPINPLPGLALGQVPPGKTASAAIPGLTGGPVQVGMKAAAGSSDKGFSSQRILWPQGGSSLEEVPGVDGARLSSDLYWDWYDQKSPGMMDWVMMANPSATGSVFYKVTIGGQDPGPGSTGTIAPGSSAEASFPGRMGGPVEVRAWTDSTMTTPANVIASQRVLSGGGSAFNELYGALAADLSSDYLWTWYDQSSPGALDWVMVANPSVTEGMYYEIDIAGSKAQDDSSTGAIGPGGTLTASFPKKMGGPVEVKTFSDKAHTMPLDSIVSQRSLWGSSFEEVPGTAASALGGTYNWTWYDQNSPGSLNWIMIDNPSATNSVYYQVKVAGQVQSVGSVNPGVIAPGGSVTPFFPGLIGGPVQVTAWTGDPDPTKGTPAGVIASQRVIWNGFFNEVLGE